MEVIGRTNGVEDPVDDEAEFWRRFFESIQPARIAIAGAMSKITETAPARFISGGIEAGGRVTDRAGIFGRRLSDYAYAAILRSPGIIVALLLLMTALVGRDALEFEHQINGDVEIYLPDGADSTELLKQVREQWATDIVILYVQTDNAATASAERGSENITDADILRQMSWIEGDDLNSDLGGYRAGLDRDKTDRGSNDGVVWVLSPAQIIKEANSSSYRFNCAVEKYALPTGQQENCAVASLNPYTGYSIPQGSGAQERIDQYVENAGSLMESFVRDTDGDGIWDTGVIIMGITFDMSDTDIPPRDDPKGISDENPSGQIRDHKAFLSYADQLIHEESRPEDCELCKRTYNFPTHSWDPERSDVIPPREAVTITGLTPVLHDVSDAIYDELMDTMLPISLLLVALMMFALHRNAKVIIICGAPIVMTLFITFGMIVITDQMLTPMIISAAPILIGLGVDYALHLTNRIEENRVNILERRAEKNWANRRDGGDEIEINPWDPSVSLSATVSAALTTGHAILLSALTTIIGFSVLMWPSIVPIAPMRTVGLTLLMGIFVTFVISMIMVPALVQLLRYRKTRSMAFDTLWDKIGEIPVRVYLLVLVIAGAFTAYGVMILDDELGKEITGSADEVPPGLSSYEALREYSIEFQGGQTNMFIVDAESRGELNQTAPIRDLPILDAIERMQIEINNVPNTTSISLVDILKAIHVDSEALGISLVSTSLWDLIHDDCWDESLNPLRPDCLPYAVTSREAMVNVAFDTLSPEIRSMLMNADQDVCERTSPCETKTLVYVNQPYIALKEAAVLRDAIDGHLTGDESCNGPLSCSAMGLDGTVNSLLTGGLPVSLDINEGIHDAQRDTTLTTVLMLLMVMSILFRSPRMAIFTMAAVGVVVLWQPILMRLGGVNVNVFTAMIGTIVFGIGVDDSIHIVDRIKDEGESPAGIAKSVARCGQTVFETTATTCAGLAAGLFVAIPGLRNFFVLMMALLFLALLASTIVLPTIVVAYRELASRIMGRGPWLDYDEAGSLVEAIDAVDSA